MSQIWVARILQVTLTYWKLDGFWWRLPPAVILHIREVQTPSQSDPELSDTQPLDLQLSFEINVASAWIIMLNVRWDGCPCPILSHDQLGQALDWKRGSRLVFWGARGSGCVTWGCAKGLSSLWRQPFQDLGNVQNKEELFVNCSKHFLITC